MILQIVQIGNSKGLRLPKSILEQFHIEKEVNLETVKDGFIIKPKKQKARNHWDKKFKEMALNKEDKMLIPENLDLNSGEWQW